MASQQGQLVKPFLILYQCTELDGRGTLDDAASSLGGAVEDVEGALDAASKRAKLFPV